MDTSDFICISKTKIAIIDRSYVGLTLGVVVGKVYKICTYDISISRIDASIKGNNSTQGIHEDALKSVVQLNHADNLHDIKPCSVYVIAEPIPIDSSYQPYPLFISKQRFMSPANIWVSECLYIKILPRYNRKKL